MKNFFSILFALVILFQSTLQVWILIGFELNREYIENNVCENRFDKIPLCKGACVLEKKFKENDSQQSKLPNLKMNEVVLYCSSINFEVSFLQPVLILEKLSFVPIDEHMSSAYLTRVFHPPNAAVI